MNDIPTVSVCMITFNHERYISEAIEGILIQKCNFNYEIVIAEDASTDETRNICLAYQKKYPDKIRLLLNEHNMGMIPNFTQALGSCTAKYIALCEGDDYWTDPNKLQKLVDFLESNPDFNLCFHDVKHLLVDGNLIANPIQPPHEVTTLEHLAVENYITTLSIVFRNDKTLLNNLPSFFSQSPIGDYPLYFLMVKNNRIKYFKENMGVYRLHPNSTFRSKPLEERYCDIMTAISLICENLELNDTIKENLLIHFRRIREEMLNNSLVNDQPLSSKTIKQLNSFDGESLLSSFYDELKSQRKVLSNSIYDANWLSKTIPITALLKSVLKKFRI